MSIKHCCWGWGFAIAALVCLPATPPRALAQANPKVRVSTANPGPQERFAFEFHDAPWSGPGSVLEWLVKKTGLPIITNVRPLGTFTPARGANGNLQRYTVPEAIDLLNAALAQQQLILIRKFDSITLRATDQPIPEMDIPRLTEAELQQRGKTELASVVVRLKTLDAETFAKEAKDMLGPLGKVTSLPSANILILRDQAGTLRLAIKMIKEMDTGLGDTSRITLTYECKHIKAADAAEALTKFLATEKEEIHVKDRAGNVRTCVRTHTIAVDEGLNMVIISGPNDKIAKAKEVLMEIDKDWRGLPVRYFPSVLLRVEVPDGNAAAFLSSAQAMFQQPARPHVYAIDRDAILVHGYEGEASRVRQFIGNWYRRTPLSTARIRLTNLKAAEVVNRLERSRLPHLQPDTERNAVLVRGTLQQIAAAWALIKILEVLP